jgi:glycosyltransferase involved in cell wall biosynthesis
MRILFLTDQVYLHGGIEKVLSQKANYLANVSNNEVFIVTYNQENKIPIYHFSDKIIFRDLCINYSVSESYFSGGNLKKIPKHIFALKKVFSTIKPDVIISSSYGPDFYFLPFIFSEIPKIKEFHSSRYFYSQNNSTFKSKIFKKLNTFVEEKYSGIVVLNESEKEFYNNKNITIIPNPSEKSVYRGDFRSKKIMAAGRISQVKKFDDLIVSFSNIKNDFPDWELHFWGEDYSGTQENLEEKIKELDVESQIKFKGITSDLKKEMQNYSIYGMTSESECFPMVLLEALSVGLPIISYDCPTGPKHILKNEKDSFLIPYKNLDIFTEKLKLLMSKENLREEMAKNGVENVQRFSMEIVMKNWKDLFNKLHTLSK